VILEGSFPLGIFEKTTFLTLASNQRGIKNLFEVVINPPPCPRFVLPRYVKLTNGQSFDFAT